MNDRVAEMTTFDDFKKDETRCAECKHKLVREVPESASESVINEDGEVDPVKAAAAKECTDAVPVKRLSDNAYV